MAAVQLGALPQISMEGQERGREGMKGIWKKGEEKGKESEEKGNGKRKDKIISPNNKGGSEALRIKLSLFKYSQMHVSIDSDCESIECFIVLTLSIHV